MRITFLLLGALALVLALPTSVRAEFGLPREAYGVWDRQGGHSVSAYPYIRGQEYGVEWTAINPARNTFDWSALDSLLQLAYDQNQKFFVKIQPVSGTTMPPWIFNAGVPKIVCPSYTYGYYLDPEFKIYFEEMVRALGKHLREEVPAHLANIVSFVRVDTGATGDEEPYEGSDVSSVPAQYQISEEEWRNYRLWVFSVYDQAFQHGTGSQIPLIFQNIEAPVYQTELEWVMANVSSAFGAKYGGQVRGHHLSESRNVPDSFKAFSVDTSFIFFSANEMDQTWKNPYFQLNLKLGMYWCAVEQLNAGMGIWDWSGSVLEDAATNDIVSTAHFFNTWAAELDPSTARGGFCIFHEGLASEDTIKFPTATYGSPATKANTARYTAICAAYASQGAKMDDLNAATLGQVAQRKVQAGFNDAGWEIWPGNYERFITQISPDSTSKGLWRVNGNLTANSHPYDRFARGFDSATSRNTMYFDINDNLLQTVGQPVRLSVDYLDRGTGQFRMRYQAVGSIKTAFTVTKTNSNTWKTASVTVTDWAFGNSGPNGADLILVNVDSDDDIFHKLEVTKLAHVQIGTVGMGTVSGRTDATTYSPVVGDEFAESQRLELTVTPAPGWEFTGWSGALTGTNERPFLFPTKDSRVTATFAPASGTTPSSAPLFSSDPIGKTAAPVNGVYSGTLSGNASDPNALPLTFSKVSGPAWLGIAADGTLSGTPQLNDLGLNRWTVLVSSSGGTDTAILLIDVTAPGPNPPSGLSYSSPPVYTQGTAINNLSPSSSGGGVMRYVATPKLPNGLRLNSTTGVISGTPTAVAATANYTITATNTDGSTTAQLNIAVEEGFHNPVLATVTLGNLSQAYNRAARSVSVTTSPSGRTVSVTYNGSPAAPTNVGNYSVNATVTQSGYTGSATGTLSITPKGLTITGLSGVNKSFDGSTSVSVTGTATLVGVETGDIVTLGGTPAFAFTNASVGINKPVSVSGFAISGGSASNYSLAQPTGLTANITAAPPPVISGATVNGTFGTPLIHAISASGDSLTFAILNGALPPGLSLDTATGVVSGTPSAAGTFSSNITASNSGGVASAAFIFVIAKAEQTILGVAPTAKVGVGASSLPGGSATSNLTVSYISSNTTIAWVSGNAILGKALGTVTVTVRQTGNANWKAAPNVIQTLQVVKGNQTINFKAPAPVVYGSPAFAIGAGATSRLPLSLSSSNPAVATVSGNMVTVFAAGNTTITATQSGNDLYNAAAPVGQILTVNRANQTITFPVVGARSLREGTVSLNATSSVGLPLEYTSSNTTVATVSGNLVTLLAPGTSTLTAMQGGSANYLPAPNFARALTVSSIAPTVTTANASPIGANAATLNGQIVSSGGTTVLERGFFRSAASGFADGTGTKISLTGNFTAGAFSQNATGLLVNTTYYYKAFARNSVGTSYGAEQSFTTLRTSQTISFGALSPRKVTDPGFTLNATATSNLTVTYTSSNPAVATVFGNVLTPVAMGPTVITASQGGDSNHLPAPNVSQTLTIGAGLPTVQTPSATAGTTSAAFNGNVVATGGASVLERGFYHSTTSGFANGMGTKTAAIGNFTTGAFSLNATGLLPNTTYYFKAFARNSAGTGFSAQQSFTTLKSKPAISAFTLNGTVGVAFTQTVNATKSPDLYTVTTGALPGGLSLNATTGVISGTPSAAGTGNFTVTATNNGGNGSRTATFTVAKGAQTITSFDGTVNRSAGQTFATTGTVNSGLPITYTSSNATIVSVGNGTLSALLPGVAVITATQPGDANWNAAALARLVVTVGTPLAGVNFTAPASLVYDGVRKTHIAATSGVTAWIYYYTGRNSTVYYGTSAPLYVGDYTLTAVSSTVTKPGYATANFTITPKPVTLSLSGLDKSYDGASSASAVATVNGRVGTDNVMAGGTPVIAFQDPSIGANKPVNATGYELAGTRASNYSLTSPSGITANITARALTVTANDVTKNLGVTLQSGPGSTAFVSNGLLTGESIASVTMTYGEGATAASANGLYIGQAVPSAAVFTSGNASNYAIQYVSGNILVSTAPAFVRPVNEGNGTVTVRWNTVPNASGYEVQSSLNLTMARALTTNGTAAEATFVLADNTVNFFRVRSVHSTFTGPWSDRQVVQLIRINPGVTHYAGLAAHPGNFTVEGIFGANNEAGLTASTTSTNATQIRMLTSTGAWGPMIFRSSTSNAWIQGTSTPAGSLAIPAGTAFTLRNPSTTLKKYVVLSGPVFAHPGTFTATPSGAGKWSLVSPLRSRSSLLSDLGFNPGPAPGNFLAGTTQTASDYIVVNDGRTVQKSYWFHSVEGRWYSGTTAQPTVPTVPAGVGLYIRQAPGSTWSSWPVPVDP